MGGNVNNDVMELLILIYACKTSMSKTITVMMPYLPYSKQCRMLRRSSIPMKLIAEMICRAVWLLCPLAAHRAVQSEQNELKLGGNCAGRRPAVVQGIDEWAW
ncbi:unnamed protein product [Heligmosomoides polygyrus]|uniref:Pribosyltran_N domain-containing protein n=1 Tax=Heligmosomoides polygyrus TaxID=6339 RepID=A0A183GTG2_HELPZ|nr:unnamed protein product [Heligmosomoides polygyrus]